MGTQVNANESPRRIHHVRTGYSRGSVADAVQGHTATESSAFVDPVIFGETLIIECVMAEYDRVLRCTATIETYSVAAHEGGAVYTKAVLTNIDSEEILAFLTPGSCLVTNHTWDDLTRA